MGAEIVKGEGAVLQINMGMWASNCNQWGSLWHGSLPWGVVMCFFPNDFGISCYYILNGPDDQQDNKLDECVQCIIYNMWS